MAPWKILFSITLDAPINGFPEAAGLALGLKIDWCIGPDCVNSDASMKLEFDNEEAAVAASFLSAPRLGERWGLCGALLV